jgi:hypothetical protein
VHETETAFVLCLPTPQTQFISCSDWNEIAKNLKLMKEPGDN